MKTAVRCGLGFSDQTSRGMPMVFSRRTELREMVVDVLELHKLAVAFYQQFKLQGTGKVRTCLSATVLPCQVEVILAPLDRWDSFRDEGEKKELETLIL
jgi:hypothetical protein